MNIYLAGQTNFGNRGCEALVRSTAAMINSSISNVKIICPLENIERDKKQWPEAKDLGVEFTISPVFSKNMIWWSRLNRVLPFLAKSLPKLKIDNHTQNLFNGIDLIIMTGGDNLTLDYGIMSLYQWCGLIEKAIDRGIPAVLWAASIGPFTENPDVEKVMIKHLKKYSLITVRESFTFKYLESLGIENVKLVADPAFLLDKAEVSNEVNTLGNERIILGFNVSPLIMKFRSSKEDKNLLEGEIVRFLDDIIENHNTSVLLIPHVNPLDGSVVNSDWAYMKKLCDRIDSSNRQKVTILKPNLNASELKSKISNCDYFMGARTHATIAALSMGIPTISIAYSAKAKGINYDLFGNQKYVLETPDVDKVNLLKSYKVVQEDKSYIKSILNRKIPEWKDRAKLSATLLKNLSSSL
ncbi:MAG: polysaccharide pyruvyl transferase family protein [Candidatus Thiodiazotropha endolucinida]|nr:polysaccharide pyruvyl transferase family protein [Candidatus Thiodiazotropha taylori]MCW4315068.1 polysaccharide pyruvyl transferase family protein [Candidatus Thiodiazotropha taylori]